MPWKPSDAAKHTKSATTDKLKRQWASVANAQLKSCLDEGNSQDDCEARAIRSANAAIKEADEEESMPGMTEATKEGGKKPTSDTTVETADPSADLEEHYYDDSSLPPAPFSATSFADLDDAKKAKEIADHIQYRTSQFHVLVENIIYNADVTDKASAIRSIADEFASIVERVLNEPDMDDIEADEFDPFNESTAISAYHDLPQSDVSLLSLTEAMVEVDNPRRQPVSVDFSIIRPGFGNKRDKRYYPAEVLERDKDVFTGVDMYTVNHTDAERSERTKVGRMRSVVGLTEDGLIGNAIIYDPDMAEKIRNRSDAGELDTLHCSIYASGSAKKGEVDGQQAYIVESINTASFVDLVAKAGAGGHAIALAESEENPMDKQQNADADPITEDTAATATETDTEQIQIQESDPSDTDAVDPAASQPEPAADPDIDPDTDDTLEQEPLSVLPAEDVGTLLEDSDLPDYARVQLLSRTYYSEADLQSAIDLAKVLVSASPRAGKPFALGESSSTTPDAKNVLDPTQLEKRKATRFKEIMADVDPAYAHTLD